MYNQNNWVLFSRPRHGEFTAPTNHQPLHPNKLIPSIFWRDTGGLSKSSIRCGGGNTTDYKVLARNQQPSRDTNVAMLHSGRFVSRLATAQAGFREFAIKSDGRSLRQRKIRSSGGSMTKGKRAVVKRILNVGCVFRVNGY